MVRPRYLIFLQQVVIHAHKRYFSKQEQFSKLINQKDIYSLIIVRFLIFQSYLMESIFFEMQTYNVPIIVKSVIFVAFHVVRSQVESIYQLTQDTLCRLLPTIWDTLRYW